MASEVLNGKTIGVRTAWLIPACLGLFGSSAALAQDREKELTAPPAIYTDLVACKSIADSGQRLACYDEKVAALETAQTSNEVVIADRKQVREARKGLFGLTLPRIRLFSGEGDEGDQITQITGTITKARTIRSGKWLITLEDGAVWQQTDVPRSTMRRPTARATIAIKRAALGSYLASVNDGRGFKVKRVVQ